MTPGAALGSWIMSAGSGGSSPTSTSASRRRAGSGACPRRPGCSWARSGFPLPAALDAKAYAEQWWEPQDGGRHRIQVKVIQPQLGLVLVYAGHFDYRLEPYPGGIAAPGYLPGYARPDGWESRV